MSETLEKLAQDQHIETKNDELEKYQFAPGNIFWVKKENKLIRLFQAGDFIDKEYLNKFKNRGARVLLEKIINEKWILDLHEYFIELKNAQRAREKSIIREKILKRFGDIFWFENSKGSLLDLIILGNQSFLMFDLEFLKSLNELDILILRRSSLMGTCFVMLALAMGYLDFRYLQDLYHICFLIDYSILKKGISYKMLDALDAERMSGLSGLEELIDQEEVELFNNHAKESLKLIEEGDFKVFKNKELLKIILFHHERLNGLGFPEKAHKAEITDIQMIFIAVNQWIPRKVEIKENDGVSFFKNFIENEEIQDKVFSKRLRNVFRNIYKEVSNDQDIIDKESKENEGKNENERPEEQITADIEGILN